MTHDDLALPTPVQFPAFPYDPPYSIQTDLMKHVYTSIENKHVTIVESPTGTGKTLSLLCSSLTWLMDERVRARKGQISQHASRSNEPSWVATQAIHMRQRELEAQDREYEERLAKARKAEARLRALARARVSKRQRVAVDVARDQEGNEDVFLPDDDAKDECDNISPAVRALMAKVDKGPGSHPWTEGEPTCTKIYYASRTHSQLTQVLPELRKLKFHLVSNHSSDLASKGPLYEPGANILSHQKKRAIEADDTEQNVETDGRQWRTVSLGSRKQLCINEAVRSSSGDLDERCRELREGKGEKRCQYLPAGQDTKLLDFRDQILATPKDIEDLTTAGHDAQTCPYYASRRAIPQAELVTLPYNLLLQKTAREALGIDLTNQVVIIDEAHNLIPTLLSLSTVRVTFDTLTTSLKQVAVYYQKFRTRLSATHSVHLKRLINYLGAIQKVVEEWKISKLKPGAHGADSKVEVLTISDFVQRLGRKVDGINLLEIETYLRQSKIAQKISGYADSTSTKDTESSKHKRQSVRTSPPLHVVEALMLGLAGAREDGRVILSITAGDDRNIEVVEIKYQLLNPSTNFNEVVDAARTVILAGGTMSPMSDVIAQLFGSTPSERISTFACGHIIPRSHVQTLVLTKGPGGSPLEFKYAQQSDRQMLSELGRIILNFCNVIPGGLVVFFPSYSSLNFARITWEADHLLHKFCAKKKVFLEPQESSGVEATLRSYAEAVRDSCANRSDKRVGPTGAILLAVVGAKLSEGLNFSDDLARAVIVVGLPFANKNSPELQERMRYVNEVEAKLGKKRQCGSKDAASELYENMCMNAVNQSIGRAIRHRSDWASLILVDRRYSSPSIGSKLPSWIKGDLCDTFGKTMKHLAEFYREKKLRAIG